MDFLQALSQFKGLNDIAFAGLILLGVVGLVWSNIRGSNKIILAMSGTIATQSKEHNMTQSEIKSLGEQEQRHHDQQSISLNKNIAALTQVMETVGSLITEVNGMRSDNAIISDMRDQLVALQATTQQQARQLEDQAIEITTLRESNAALLNNLNVERTNRLEAERQLIEERKRNRAEVDMLKAQFNQLNKAFLAYRKQNGEDEKHDDLPQHPEQPDPTNG